MNKVQENQTTAPTYYNSTFRHGVDEKRRVQIPAKWRPAESGVEFTLIVWPQAKEGPCLRVLPPAQMARLMKDIDAIPNNDPGKVALKRFIGSESVQAALDKAGRICIPDEMAKAAGIEKEAVLVGMIDRFEIWNPERHALVKASDAVIAPVALMVMGA